MTTTLFQPKRWLALLALLFFLPFIHAENNNANGNDDASNSCEANIYGDCLEPCSSSGYAMANQQDMTAYCTENTYYGRVCLDVSALGDTGPCHDDVNQEDCAVQNKCHRDAYFTDEVDDTCDLLVCNALSLHVLNDWLARALGGQCDVAEALQCVRSKCGISARRNNQDLYYAHGFEVCNSRGIGIWAVLLALGVSAIGLGYYYVKFGHQARHCCTTATIDDLGRPEHDDAIPPAASNYVMA